ncbi:glycoside hydrolase family 88 protein [Mucilaginibacter sp. UR6-1]|uniref:glycoside hydrolase family 88 protein n=1 Tax=Mucilaginibacter sp. UR6-1 TaxID=1435643 RepID=UPI001E329232|nr:glycoside hydrolase family 88 protein [Mucilaginibacter sp. UR6-1]MCC8408317.1 glycoside hydrolase family 88 protein [Mucilaginibacter sp. UR6-1]
MIKHLSKTALLLIALAGCKSRDEVSKQPEDALKAAVKHYEYLAAQVEPGKYPKTYHANKKQLETSGSDWWCSGFFPGTLLYLDEAQNAPHLKEKALAVLEDLKREQYNKTTHDLGFMMYCSFGNAERLNPKKEYEDVLMQSAKSLITRYKPAAKCIQSWDSAPWNNAGPDEMPVIIDNMMNLELLFWASKFSGDSTYKSIAINHANTTMLNHFRPDYSTYHVVIYNKNTGKATKRITAQGTADNSSWARGQAWGLYGYTVMYRETKDDKYLQQANHIANYILTLPTMPKNLIPYWDYQAPGIPNALHDSSAGAITASALIELSGYVDKELSAKYVNAAKTILTALSSPEYFAEQGTNGGFLLKHGVGNMPNKTEIDVPLSYGDYYFVEALMRYQKLK